MRVLLCDDSAVMRRIIRQILEAEPGIEIVGVARNGRECVDLARDLRPDLITLDIEMPVMNGLDALRRIMARTPTHVIVVSSLTADGSRESLKALRLGAVDVVAKDHANFTTNAEALRDDILARVHALSQNPHPREPHNAPNTPTATQQTRHDLPANEPTPQPQHPARLALIAASTGGPPIVEHVLSRLNTGTNIAFVIAQHMPHVFTQSLAAHLNDSCPLPVVHLDPGVSVEPGRVHVAPGGLNTHIRADLGDRFTVRIDREPKDTLYFPSATALLTSAAKTAGQHTLAAVLTGMGADGADGVTALRNANGTVVAQDRRSSVVYGMPQAAAERGATTRTPDQIRDLLARASLPNTAAA